MQLYQLTASRVDRRVGLYTAQAERGKATELSSVGLINGARFPVATGTPPRRRSRQFRAAAHACAPQWVGVGFLFVQNPLVCAREQMAIQLSLGPEEGSSTQPLSRTWRSYACLVTLGPLRDFARQGYHMVLCYDRYVYLTGKDGAINELVIDGIGRLWGWFAHRCGGPQQRSVRTGLVVLSGLAAACCIAACGSLE